MFSYRLSIFGIVMITLLAGCAAPAAQSQATAGPTAPPVRPPPTAIAPRDERRPAAPSSDAARAAADRALVDLAQRLGVSQAEIEVLGVQPIYRGSSNTDSAGASNGWRVRLGVTGNEYLYQVDARGALKRLPGR